MKDTPVFERLRRLNPVQADPSPPPIAELLEQLDEAVRRLQDPAPPAAVPRGGPMRRPLALAGAAACGVAAAGVILSVLPGGGSVNVAEAMYRALTPVSGVLHVSTITETTTGGHATVTSTEHLWSAQNPRRMRVVLDRSEGVDTEFALDTKPMKLLQWDSWQPEVIKQSVPSGVPMAEVSPVEAVRMLYAKKALTLAGKTATVNGRAEWRLEVHPSTPQPTFEGRQLPNPVLLVDASTFVPLELLSESVTKGPGPTELIVQKVRYTEYQEFAGTAQSEALLRLASHPGARVQNEE